MRRLLIAAGLSLAVLCPAWAAEATPSVFSGKFQDFEQTSGKVVGVYMANWKPVALVDELKTGNVTHVLYAFLRLCGPGQLPQDAPKCEGKQDFQIGTSQIDARFNEAFARLKRRAPHVKVVASVGGWGGSDPFFHLNTDPAKRAVFAASAADFLRTHPAFDGIDIDWEHPTNNSAANGVQLGSPADGQGYADLMHDLRGALNRLTAENGQLYILTTAINPTQPIVGKVNFREAAKHLDLVFMMTYDFYGNWSKTAGNHSALRDSAGGDDSLESSVRNLTQAGVPPAKLVAGVAMYGRGFHGVAQPAAGKGASFSGAAKQGSYPGPDGSTSYRFIADNYLGPLGKGRRGYQPLFDEQTQAWNLWHGKHQLFMGYDDPRAVIAKGRFALKAGLAGLFAWEYSQDNGDVLNAMNLGLGNIAIP